MFRISFATMILAVAAWAAPNTPVTFYKDVLPVLQKHCQTCHARNGKGAKVGPDLISVAGRPPDDILVAILDPSREVPPDGLSVVVVTNEGRTLTGGRLTHEGSTP